MYYSKYCLYFWLALLLVKTSRGIDEEVYKALVTHLKGVSEFIASENLKNEYKTKGWNKTKPVTILMRKETEERAREIGTHIHRLTNLQIQYVAVKTWTGSMDDVVVIQADSFKDKTFWETEVLKSLAFINATGYNDDGNYSDHLPYNNTKPATNDLHELLKVIAKDGASQKEIPVDKTRGRSYLRVATENDASACKVMSDILQDSAAKEMYEQRGKISPIYNLNPTECAIYIPLSKIWWNEWPEYTPTVAQSLSAEENSQIGLADPMLGTTLAENDKFYFNSDKSGKNRVSCVPGGYSLDKLGKPQYKYGRVGIEGGFYWWHGPNGASDGLLLIYDGSESDLDMKDPALFKMIVITRDDGKGNAVKATHGGMLEGSATTYDTAVNELLEEILDANMEALTKDFLAAIEFSKYLNLSVYQKTKFLNVKLYKKLIVLAHSIYKNQYVLVAIQKIMQFLQDPDATSFTYNHLHQIPKTLPWYDAAMVQVSIKNNSKTYKGNADTIKKLQDAGVILAKTLFNDKKRLNLFIMIEERKKELKYNDSVIKDDGKLKALWILLEKKLSNVQISADIDKIENEMQSIWVPWLIATTEADKKEYEFKREEFMKMFGKFYKIPDSMTEYQKYQTDNGRNNFFVESLLNGIQIEQRAGDTNWPEAEGWRFLLPEPVFNLILKFKPKYPTLEAQTIEIHTLADLYKERDNMFASHGKYFEILYDAVKNGGLVSSLQHMKKTV